MQSLSRCVTKTPLIHNTISLFSSQKLPLIIISFGILVRLIQYLHNRSLWADEAVLALNIINRSYLELLQPLDYEQGAPLGFLMLEKFAVQLFGNNEYALRLFPLLFGILSLLLFYKLAKRFLPLPAIQIALVLFASEYYLIYYSSEVKQYSSDVFFSLCSCWLVLYLNQQKQNFGQLVFLAVAGATVIWFSHPAIFVLSGVGLSCFLTSSFIKQKSRTIVLGIYSVWVLSFTVFYFVALKNLGNSKDLMASWKAQGAFPSSSFDILWLFDSLRRYFYDPLGFTGGVDALAIIAFLLGCFSLFFKNKSVLLTLLSPIAVTVFAAYLYKYPFGSRLVLFLSPFFILIIAEGANSILKKRSSYRVVVSIIFLALLLTPSLLNASKLIVKPDLQEEIKPVIAYVKAHQKPQDVLYIFQRGQYQFQYYAEKYGYQTGDYVVGVDDLDKFNGKDLSDEEWNRYKTDLDKLRGNNRVWLLFSHAWIDAENQRIKAYLDGIGKQNDFFESTGAFVYLYDLN